MWFIQSPVDALLLPTDGVGRSTLTGNVAPWQHLVRDSTFSPDSRVEISSARLRWSIWPWQQTGRRVQLPEALAGHESLAFMVRAEPTRACVFAHFPKPGKRTSDDTIELIVVVPPEHFHRYELLVHFAMTLPSGHVGLTIPSPVLTRELEDGSHVRALIDPGSNAVMEGMEMVVARAKPQKFTRAEIRVERRANAPDPKRNHAVHDDDDEWRLFAAAPVVEPPGGSEDAG